jgi:hypothetical protein
MLSMHPSIRAAAHHSIGRAILRLLALFLSLFFAFFVSTGSLFANTVTIVDGPNVPPQARMISITMRIFKISSTIQARSTSIHRYRQALD